MRFKKGLIWLAMLILLLGAVSVATAAPPPQKPAAPPQANVSLGTDPNPGIESLSGSFVVFDPSVGGDTCYIPGVTQTFCFRAESFTNDWEYVYNLWERFPTDWTVTNVYVQGTPVCDSGSWGAFSWSFQTPPYEVNISHARYQTTTDHCTAYYCFEVISGSGTPDALESWYWSGDEYGNPPHHPCSNDNYTPGGQPACDEAVQPRAAIPPCTLDPIMLTPENIELEGCAFEPQQHTFTVWNNAGYDTTVLLSYSVIAGTGTCSGPDSVSVPNGGNLPIVVDLTPQGAPGDTVVCQVYAEDASNPNNSDVSWITKHLVEAITYWEQIATMPDGRMDNVVGAYGGYIWDVTGYGAGSSVYRYDPVDDSWTTLTPTGTVPPAPNYARSGCTHGNMIYTYGDSTTSGFTGLWGYNMDTNTWAQLTPSGTPPPYSGIWAPAWVHDPATGLCYMTGGATAPGGGNLTTVYVYDPENNAWLDPLPNFTTARDFHAAFIHNGMLCVMGGVDASNVVYTSTQCYNGTSWNPENADIPPIPMGWWGMGYADKWHGGTDHQLWLVNGADAAFQLTNNSAYYDVNDGAWVLAGPLPSGSTYRTSATTLDNEIYKIAGSTGGFNYSGLSDHHVQILCQPPSEFDAWKEAPAEVLSGETMRYTITIAAPALAPGMFMTDVLPVGVEYANNLTYTAGYAWYDADDNAVYWTYPGPKAASAPAWIAPSPSGVRPSSLLDLGASNVGHDPDVAGTPRVNQGELLLDQQPNQTNGIFTDVSCDLCGGAQVLAENFAFAEPKTIGQIVLWSGYYPSDTPIDPDNITVIFHEDAGGLPGPVVAVESPVAYERVQTGIVLFGVHEWRHTLTLATPVALDPGNYWIEIYNDTGWGSDDFFWEAGNPDTIGNGLFDSAVALEAPGVTWYYPVGYELALQLYGPIGEEVQIAFDVLVTAYCGETIVNEGVAGDGTTVVTFDAATAVLGEPEIEVTPPSLWAEICPDSTGVEYLQICNVGTCDLEWEIHEMTPTLALAGSMPFVPVKVAGQGINPGLTAASPAAQVTAVPPSPEDVLWDQPLSSVNQNAYVDQDFTDYPDYSSFLADDFVNADPWQIESIFVPGNGWNGFTTLLNATALTWQIYADDGTGFPDGDPSGGGNPPVWTLTLAPTDTQVIITNGSGGMPSDTKLTLAAPFTLPPGHWWLVFYPTMAFDTGGQYGRQPADTTNGYWGKFINPGGGFGLGTEWQDWSIIGATQQDIAFRIEGTIAGPGYPDFPWISEDPVTGTILAGECMVVEVTFDSTGLPAGDYFADLLILSNDADEPQVTVPVTMTVLVPIELVDVTYTINDLEVTFDATVTGSEPFTFAWDFGDGNTSDLEDPVHLYEAGGCYTVTLTASNACGQVTWSDEICVCDPAHNADFSWMPAMPVVGATVTFTATVEGTAPFTYTWAFGDGGTGEGMVVTHVYTAAGDYIVALTVENACGQTVVTDTVKVELGLRYYYLPLITKNF